MCVGGCMTYSVLPSGDDLGILVGNTVGLWQQLTICHCTGERLAKRPTGYRPSDEISLAITKKWLNRDIYIVQSHVPFPTKHWGGGGGW